MKKTISILLCLAVMLTLSATAMASPGSGNIDGGGGSFGQGTSGNFWISGDDGVRVTIVDANSGSVVSTPVDFSNRDPGSLIHFGKVSKLQYRSGASLSPASGAYRSYRPSQAIPTIIRSGGSNIEAIRRYFCSEYAAKLVANATGFDYSELISGKYRLFIEPLAFFTHNGLRYAMTATEAALYDERSGGRLRRTMPSLTHMNLPFSIFLERPAFGFPVYSGSTRTRQSNDTIIASLGMGIVSYGGSLLVPPEPGEAEYEYRVNTEVITAVTLHTYDEINPDDPASVTFSISGRAYTVNSIVIPEGGSQLVWVKWTTPATEQRITISVTNSAGFLSENIITADIVDLGKNPPPDPLATDRNNSFKAPPLPSKTQSTSASWSVWWAQWQSNWIWVSNWVRYSRTYTYIDANGNEATGTSSYRVDEGWWEDRGWFDFLINDFSASLSATNAISPDSKVPTAAGMNMKSGYGINNIVTANITTNAPSSHIAGAQTAVSYFPEFSYDTYWRLLEKTSGTLSTRLEFRQNPYSTYNQRAHFTPVWYPNGTYTVYTWLLDAWTPTGMLSMNLSGQVNIHGSLFDDWYTNRE